MIYIGICDDDDLYRDYINQTIVNILQSYNVGFQIYEFISGEDILANYPDRLDILILDIKMKNINGMDVARNIRRFDKDVEIIFTTYVIDFIHDGYEVNAYRYLLKPLQEEEIVKHVQSCLDTIINSSNNHLSIINKNYIDRIKIDSIIYVKTQRPNLIVNTLDNNSYSIRMSMSKMEEILKNNNFYRCHSSYIINLKYVKSIYSNYLIINNVNIPISKYRIRKLKLALTQVLGDIIC